MCQNNTNVILKTYITHTILKCVCVSELLF